MTTRPEGTVAFEYWNHETGHCLVDYGHPQHDQMLKDGYTAHPLMYVPGYEPGAPKRIENPNHPEEGTW